MILDYTEIPYIIRGARSSQILIYAEIYEEILRNEYPKGIPDNLRDHLELILQYAVRAEEYETKAKVRDV